MQRPPFSRRPGTNAVVRNVPDDPVEPIGLPDEDVDALFSRLTPFSDIMLAVSGGADSLCLLVLFCEWKARSHWSGTAAVVVVDHQLRAESAAEAEFVRSAARQRGLQCDILRWTGQKPSGNLQEEARSARYRLISEHMKASGAQVLLLAHHLDDQAETFLDRLTRGSGLFGLSAMSADQPDGLEGLHLLRPFLGVPKKELVVSLEHRGLSWCEDPSNQSEKYKRSRLRRLTALLAEEGLTVDRMAQTALQLRRAREALEGVLLRLYEDSVVEHPAGPLKLDMAVFRKAPEELRLRLLSLLVARVTGRPKHLRLSKLQKLDNEILAGEVLARPLSGAMFSLSRDWLVCWREVGRTPPETVEVAKVSGPWDARFSVECLENHASRKVEAGLFLGALCNAPVRSREVIWPEGWPKQAFACSPVVWSESGMVHWMPETLGVFEEKADLIPGLDLARLPFQGKLVANHMQIEDTGAEI